MLSKKVDTLSKAMEVEAKKMRREVTVMEKEVAAMRVDKDQERRTRRLSMSKEPVNSSSQRLTGRFVVLSHFELATSTVLCSVDLIVFVSASWEARHAKTYVLLKA